MTLYSLVILVIFSFSFYISPARVLSIWFIFFKEQTFDFAGFLYCALFSISVFYFYYYFSSFLGEFIV